MKYYFDTEFIEGPQTKRFLGFRNGETKPTIDLISIGIVAEDGREYYAISKDFNLREAWNRFDLSGDGSLTERAQRIYWIRENVLKPIYMDLLKIGNIYGDERNHWSFTYRNLKKLINKYGKTNKQISEEVKGFIGKDKPEFYAYYADYDWVVFCWTFGKMIQLPDNFPQYAKDLQQIFDEKKRLVKGRMEDQPGFPINEGLHNAIEDARWNKNLHEFLDKII